MKKQKFILPLIIILVFAVGLGAYYLLKHNDTVERTSSDSLSNELIKQADEEPEITEADQRGEDENTAPGEGSGEGKLQAPTISTLEQSGDMLVVRAVINNSVTSGSCSLKLTKGNTIIEKKAPIGLVTSYYTCQGFDVAISELGSTGTWTATVKIESGNSSAISSPNSIEVK